MTKRIPLGIVFSLSLLIVAAWHFFDTSPPEYAAHIGNLEVSATQGEVPTLVQRVFDEHQAHLLQVEEQALIKRYQEQLFDRFDFISFDGETIWVDSEHFKYLSDAYFPLMREWYATLGIFTKDDLAGYASYDVETLEALGDQGDLRAWHTLANVYLEQLNEEKMIETLKKAAVHGSAVAITRLGRDKRHGMYSFLTGYDSELDKGAVIGWLAHSEVAHRLGHPDTQRHSTDTLESTNLHLHLTESDWQEIDRAADSLFAELEASRQELGLGEFNTELPEHVIGYNQNRKDIQAFREAAEQLNAKDDNG